MNTTNDFLLKLDSLLRDLPENVRREMLYDYEEHFNIGLDNGKSIQEIERELGDPEDIARDFLSDYRQGLDHSMPEYPEYSKPGHTSRSTVSALFRVIGLILFNLIFIVGPVAGLLGVYIGLCVTAVSLILSPILFLFYPYTIGFETLLSKIFLSMACEGLGLLIGAGVILLGKYIFSLLLRYLNFNLKIIRPGGGMEI